MSVYSPLLQAILILQICVLSRSQYQYQPQNQYQPQMMQAMQQQPYPAFQQMPAPAQGMPAMPMPMPIGMTQPRLPVVVMPFRSGKNDKSSKRRHHKKKKRRRSARRKSLRIMSSGSDSEGDYGDVSSSSDADLRSARKALRSKSRRHQVLTPVISYVTKDGYVVYQKKIKKEKANDWLGLTENRDQALESSGEKTALSVEMGKKAGHRRRY